MKRKGPFRIKPPFTFVAVPEINGLTLLVPEMIHIKRSFSEMFLLIEAVPNKNTIRWFRMDPVDTSGATWSYR